MTQAGAAAPISSAAADVLTAADSRGPTTEQLACQQIGDCCSEELSATLEKQSSVDSEDSGSSGSSSQAGASTVDTNSDEWLKQFLEEYAKAARYTVPNFSNESEGFDFGGYEEESEAVPESAYVSSANDKCNLDTQVGDENNLIKTDSGEITKEESHELQRSVLPCESANLSSLEAVLGFQDECNAEVVNQQCEGKGIAVSDGETNSSEPCLPTVECCQGVSKDAAILQQHSFEKRPSHSDRSSHPESVLQHQEPREDIHCEGLIGSLDNCATSSLLPCVDVSAELNPSQQWSAEKELDNHVTTKVVHEELEDDKSNDFVYGNSQSRIIYESSPCKGENDVSQLLMDSDSDKTTSVCAQLEADPSVNIDLKIVAGVPQTQRSTIVPENNDKTKIIFQNSESNNFVKTVDADDVIAEQTSSDVLPQVIKMKVEKSQISFNSLNTTNIEERGDAVVNREQSCEDILVNQFTNNSTKEQSSASILYEGPRLNNGEPLINCQSPLNESMTSAANNKDSGSEKIDKHSFPILKSNNYFSNNSSKGTQNENLPSRLPTDSLSDQRVSKYDAQDGRCEVEKNSSSFVSSNSKKVLTEGVCEPEKCEYSNKITIDNSEDPPKAGVNSAVESQRIHKDISVQNSLLDNNHQCQSNNVTPSFTTVDHLRPGLQQEISKETAECKSTNPPVDICSEVQKKTYLLRKQFFEKNPSQGNDGSLLNNSGSTNQSISPLNHKEKTIPQQMFVNNKSCDNSRNILDASCEKSAANESVAGTSKNVAATAPYTKLKKETERLKNNRIANIDHEQTAFEKIDSRTSPDRQKKNQRPSSRDKSSKRLVPSSRSHKEALLTRVTHKQAILKHSPPPLVLLNGAAVDSVGKSVKSNGAGDTQFNGQLLREVHELFSGFATSATDARSEPICCAGKVQAEAQCHSAQQLQQHRMFGKEQSGSNSSSESATPTNDEPWILSFSDKEVLKASYKVNCKICRKPYNDPRILPCLHTFCAICLDQCESFISSDSDVVCNGEGGRNRLKDRSPDTLSNRTLSPSPENNAVHQNHPSPSTSSLRLHKNSIHHLSTAASPESSNLSTSSSSSFSNSSSNFEQKRTILCPLCDAEVDLPAQGAHFLPVNYIAKKQLLDTMGNGLKSDVGCDLCSSDSETCAMYCSDCSINMCPFCSEAHRRQKKTSSHHVISIHEAKIQGTISKSSVISCPSHPQEELKLFCETCVRTVCRDCVIVSHRDHICHFISEVSDKQTVLLKEVLDQLKPRNSALKQLVDNLHVSSKQVDLQAERTWEQVNIFVDNFIQALQIHRKNLLSQIRKIKCQKQESLTLHRIQVEQALEDLESSFLFASQLLELNSEVEFLTLLGPVLQRLRDLGKESLNPEIQNDCGIVFNPFEKAGVVHGFPVLGTISTQQTTLSQCIVKGDGLLTARQGQRSDVFLITRCPNGSLKKKGGENVQAEMISKDTPSKSIPVDVVDCQDGSYLITFSSDTTGLFLLHVTLEGKPVQGSPFVIPVKPKLRQHSGVFHCCSFCSSAGSKEARCACGGTMPGGYKGCGHGHSSHPGCKHWSCCGKTEEKSDCSRPTSATYEFTL